MRTFVCIRRGAWSSALLFLMAFAYGQDEEPTVTEAAPVEGETRGEEAPSESAEPEAPEEAAHWTDWFDGQLQTNLRLERSRRDSDVLLDQILRFDLEPPKYEKLRIRGGLWLLEDLDGHEDSSSSISGIHNTYEASVQLRVLHLYAEFEDLWGSSTLRLGRQRILDSPAYPRIDGGYFKRLQGRWTWYVFGGARASLYESSHDELTVGGGAAYDLTRRTRLQLDLFYGEQEDASSGSRRLGDLIAAALGFPVFRRDFSQTDSDMVSVSMSHRLTDRHSLYGRYTVFDGESDEFVVTAAGVFGERDFVYDVTYRRREQAIGNRADDVTGFFRVLGEQNEFDELLATLHIPLGEQYSLALEGHVRETDDDQPYSSNRDFRRFAATFSAYEIWRGIDADFGVEYWDVDDSETSFAVTGGVSREWERWDLSVGVDFQRWEDRIVAYRPGVLPATRLIGVFSPFVRRNSALIAALFDTDVIETRENVYSLYTRAGYRITDRQEIEFALSWDKDDGPDSPYWQFEATYRVRF